MQADVVARVKCARSPLLPPRIMSLATVRLEELASAVSRADCPSLVVAPTEGDLVAPNASHCPPVHWCDRLMEGGKFRVFDFTRQQNVDVRRF